MRTPFLKSLAFSLLFHLGIAALAFLAIRYSSRVTSIGNPNGTPMISLSVLGAGIPGTPSRTSENTNSSLVIASEARRSRSGLLRSARNDGTSTQHAWKAPEKTLNSLLEEQGKLSEPPLKKGVGGFAGADNVNSLSSGASGDGGSGAVSKGDASVLIDIKAKLERAKRYPRQAVEDGLSGRVEIAFSVDPNGGVRDLVVSKSSGVTVLDREALATVSRAIPLPYYAGPITVPIVFEIR